MAVFLHLTGVNNLNVHAVGIGQMANIHLHLKLHLKVLKSLHETVFTRQQFVDNSICPCSIRKQTAPLCLSSVFPALPLSNCMSGHIIRLYLYLCQAAERDWEEKRASLTQFSAQDINRLLEETQAELMKAIPDLDFAARHINKPAVPPKPQITIPLTSTTASPSAAGTTGTAATTSTTTNTTSSGDQQPGKVQLAAQKLNSMEGAGSHRGSGGSVPFQSKDSALSLY